MNKTRLPLIAIGTAVLLLIGLFWMRRIPNGVVTSHPAQSAPATSARAANLPALAVANQHAPSSVATRAITDTYDGETQEEHDRRVARLEAQANAELAATDVPIRFFGKVVDQSSAPISAVEVSYRFNKYDLTARYDMAQEQGKVMTDDAGLFTISGIRGHSITIEHLSKAGYEPVGLDGRWYYYALLTSQSGKLFRSDSAAPVVYRMWHLEGPQELRSYTYRGEVLTDGTPKFLSPGSGLLHGRSRLSSYE